MGARTARSERCVRRVVVSDTGPLLHLTEAASIHLLEPIGEVHIPRMVDQEMRHHEASWSSTKPHWIKLTPLVEPHATEAQAWHQAGLLDAGEAEAIALARQLRADWLLTDDAAARLLAGSLGLEAHGSLGVVLWAAAIRHLTRVEAEAALDDLANSSLWISACVLAEAKAALDQLFS